MGTFYRSALHWETELEGKAFEKLSFIHETGNVECENGNILCFSMELRYLRSTSGSPRNTRVKVLTFCYFPFSIKKFPTEIEPAKPTHSAIHRQRAWFQCDAISSHPHDMSGPTLGLVAVGLNRADCHVRQRTNDTRQGVSRSWRVC
jgi:hypothetical protein